MVRYNTIVVPTYKPSGLERPPNLSDLKSFVSIYLTLCFSRTHSTNQSLSPMYDIGTHLAHDKLTNNNNNNNNYYYYYYYKFSQ